MNLLQMLLSLPGAFFPRNPIDRTVRRAMLLTQQGKRPEALRLLEMNAQLEPCDYQDRQRLAAKLKRYFNQLDSNTIAMYVMTLTGTLGAQERRKDALAVFDADALLEADDYTDTKLLSQKLAVRLQGWNTMAASFYWQSLAGVLAMDGHHADALRVTEAYLGLEPADYDNPSTLAKKLQERLDPLPTPFAVMYILILSGAQSILGRSSQSATLVRAFLGFGASDHALVVSTIKERIRQLPTDLAIALVNVILFADDIQPDEIVMLEAITGLEEADYKNRPVLARKLRRTLGKLIPDNAVMYMMMLIALLDSANRYIDALTALEADIGLEEQDYQDAQRLASKLHKRFAPLADEASSTYLRTLVVTLENLERYKEAVFVQEVDAGLIGTDYDNAEELTAQLKQRLQPLTEGTGAAYTFQIVSTLDTAGLQTQAEKLADSYMSTIVNLYGRPEDDHSPVFHVCALADYWLEHYGTREQERTLSFCQRIVPYVRRNLAQRGITLRDRTDFIEYVGKLRQRIVELGHYWANREQDTHQAKQLWLTTLLWDTELTQRLLWERFLLSQLDEAVPPDTFPGLTWPCIQRRPATTSYLPPVKRLAVLGDGASNDEYLAFLEDMSVDNPPQIQLSQQKKTLPLFASNEPVVGEQESVLKRAHPELFERGSAIVQQGIDEHLLARSLGPHSLLLRATFDLQEGLSWMATTSDGQTLHVAAYGNGPSASQVRWIVAKYDLRCQMVRLILKPSAKQNIIDPLQNCLDYLATYLKWVVYGQPGGVHGLEQGRGRLLAVIQNMINWAAQQQWSVQDLLEICYTPLLQAPTETEKFVPWVVEALNNMQGLFQILVDGLPPPKSNLQELLNAATQDLLQEMAALWPLDTLAEVLTPQMDVIVQVDDVLHALPLAHIFVAGRPLYQYVRSVRTSISMLLTMLQQEAESDFLAKGASTSHLLVVSWFDEVETAARDAVKWLHHGHFLLAQEYGMLCYAAADRPPGTLGGVSAALADGETFRVMTVCGHGNRHNMGVKLRNEHLWDGGGCDLSKVEWLLMVSCSIGRLEQSGDRDVEGFCVKLSLHRALSVLACRWAINALEACTFTNEVVQCYLQLCKEHDEQHSRDRECLRARALNDARKYFLGDGNQERANPHVGLNTIGAFELYGIG